MIKKFEIHKKFEINQPQRKKKFEINDSQNSIEREIEEGLGHIRNLGPKKPMGYLPIDTLKSYFKSSVEQEVVRAKEKGYKFLIAKHAPVGFEGGLYVYDDESLQEVLNLNKDILLKHAWPTTSEEFVLQVSRAWVLDNPEVKAVIQKAFGDYRS